MKKCPKCGIFLGENDNICGVCGAALASNTNVVNNEIYNNNLNQQAAINQSFNNFQENNQVQQNSILMNNGTNNNLTQNINDINQNYNQQHTINNNNILNNSTMISNNYNNQSSYIDKEILLKCYVGPNYEKLSDNSFSWCTFFLEVLYIFYRKKYVWGITWILITVLLNMFGSMILGIGSLLLCIYQAVIFKKTYIKESKNKVDKIIEQNRDKSFDELKRICAKKGGTNIILPCLIVALGIGMFILSVILVMNTIDEAKNNETKNNVYSYITCVEKGVTLEYLNNPDQGFVTEITDINDDRCESYSYNDITDVVLTLEEGSVVSGTITIGNNIYSYHDGSVELIN